MLPLSSSLPTSPTRFIQIDETLANSRLQWLVWGGLMALLFLMIFGLNLPLSYQLALVILLILCVIISQILPYQVTAISTLPLAKNSTMDNLGEVEWQLGINQLDISNFFTPNQQSTQLWQAVLVKVDNYQVAMILSFEVITPLEKKLSLIIWQDQVTPDTWRQLCVLATL